MNVEELVSKIQSKNKKFISRGISFVENEHAIAIPILNELHKSVGKAYRIGVTGPPGAGKSTITNELTKLLLSQNKSVGIIAIDPTSPFTGGAVLGDRIRMNEIGTRENVFIRSMATRGSLGGLSNKTIDAGDVLDGAGFDYIIYETVGVGQSELDIVKTADTTMVVLVPESGDSIQAMKAGLMEIADLFVMNKGDRPGSDTAILSLKTTLALKDHDEHTFMPKILKCIASKGEGIKEIFDEVEYHRSYMIENNLFSERRNTNNKIRVRGIVEGKISSDIWTENRREILSKEIELINKNKLSPYQSAVKIIDHYKKEILDK